MSKFYIRPSPRFTKQLETRYTASISLVKIFIYKVGLDNPRAADDFFLLVEDGGVAGGDGALGFVEGD